MNLPDTTRSSYFLWAELIFLFAALPCLGLFPEVKMLVFGLLWALAFGAYIWLRRHDKGNFLALPTWPQIKMRLVMMLVLGFVLCVLGYIFMPERFLQLPLERPYLFAAIVFFYPFLSALPQEIVYRGFFMARYAPLFRNDTQLIIASAVAFSLAHLAFGNLVALVLSFLGGLLFAQNYSRTRSVIWVSVEHSFYGLLVFTAGLGWYFYLGAGHSFFAGY